MTRREDNDEGRRLSYFCFLFRLLNCTGASDNINKFVFITTMKRLLVNCLIWKNQ
jgi:hypothetical protein